MKRKLLGIWSALLLSSLLLGCGGGGGESSAPASASPQTQTQTPTETPPQTQTPTPTQTPEPVKASEYITSVTPVTSKVISASQGGVVEVADANSLINGIKLTIPAGALSIDTTIGVGHVNNPSLLPIGLNFVGAPIDFGPDGTTFSTPATLEIPFSQLELDQAGVPSKTALKLFVFDKKTDAWSEAKILYIDTVKNVVVGQVEHFSFYSLVGLNGASPSDLGKPQPGDLLFRLSTYDGGFSSGWAPAHVGMYTGEKVWDGKGRASDDVFHYGVYNTIEALPGGVQYSYYKIPNVSQAFDIKTPFSGNTVYMGARELIGVVLTSDQRAKILDYAKNQVGKPYVIGETMFGLLDGYFVKGPDNFNCVGLVEKAYELAGVNGGQGIVKDDEWKLLTPAWQYSKTKPAGGVDAAPVIKWASLSPNYGSATTQVLAQIAVSHSDGLSYIDSVRYVTDSGFVNPNISINDAGVAGDLKSGDGTYSSKASAGRDSSMLATMGLTFTVTDKGGKSDSIRLIYTYSDYGSTTAKQTSEQLLYESGSWAK